MLVANLGVSNHSMRSSHGNMLMYQAHMRKVQQVPNMWKGELRWCGLRCAHFRFESKLKCVAS